MPDCVPDTQIIKKALAYRAKYRTKRQEPKQNLMCWQLVPHPSNRGGEVIRSRRTKVLAGDIIEAGYDPVEGSLDSVSVEAKVDSSGVPSNMFSDHFEANTGMDPEHYVCNTHITLFAALSQQHQTCIRTEHITRNAGLWMRAPRHFS